MNLQELDKAEFEKNEILKRIIPDLQGALRIRGEFVIFNTSKGFDRMLISDFNYLVDQDLKKSK